MSHPRRRPHVPAAAPSIVNVSVPFSLGDALSELGATAPAASAAPPVAASSRSSVVATTTSSFTAGSKRPRPAPEDAVPVTARVAVAATAGLPAAAVQPRTIDEYVHALIPYLGTGIHALMLASARPRALREIVVDAPSPARLGPRAAAVIDKPRGASITVPSGKPSGSAIAGSVTASVKRELTGSSLRSQDGEDLFLRACASCPLDRLVHAHVLRSMARVNCDGAANGVIKEAGEPPCTPLHLLPHTPTYANTRDLFLPSGAAATGAWPGSPLVYSASFAALLLEETRAVMSNALHVHLRALNPPRPQRDDSPVIPSRARWRIAAAPVPRHGAVMGADTMTVTLTSDARLQQRDVNASRWKRDRGGADPNDAETWQLRDMLLCVREEGALHARNNVSTVDAPPMAFLAWVTSSARAHGGAAGTGPVKLTARGLWSVVSEVLQDDDDAADERAPTSSTSSKPTWHVYWCGSVTTAMQSYQSLEVMTATPFAGAVIRPHTAQPRPLAAAQSTLQSSITAELWAVLQTRYDASQLAAIALMCAGGQYHVPCVDAAPVSSGNTAGCEMTCIVGPPGTGKTRTLIGALSAMRAMKLHAVGNGVAAKPAPSASTTVSTLSSAGSARPLPVARVLPAAAAVDEDVHMLSRNNGSSRSTTPVVPDNVIDLTHDEDVVLPGITSAMDQGAMDQNDSDDEVEIVIDADSDATVPELPVHADLAIVPRAARTATAIGAAAGSRTRGPKRAHMNAYADVDATMLAPPVRVPSRAASLTSEASQDDNETGARAVGLGLLRDVMRPVHRAHVSVQANIVPAPIAARAPTPSVLLEPAARSVATPAARGAQFRVLVCAPSNAAVDEIVSRLLAPVEEDATGGMCDERGQPYTPRVLRLGAGAASSRRFTTSDAVADAIVMQRYQTAVIATAAARAALRPAPSADSRGTSTHLEREIAERQRELVQLEAASARAQSSATVGHASAADGSSRAHHQPQLYSPVTKRRAAALRDDIARMETKQRFERLRHHLTDAEHAVCAARALHESVLDAEIVVCTLSAAARLFSSAAASLPHGALTDHIDMDAIPGARFDAFIVDEAGQAIEPETCIPLRHAFAGFTHTRRPDMHAEEMCASTSFHSVCRRLILVGDPIQLPATVISTTAAAAGLHTSLFERLARSGCRPHILQMQYRMPPAISAFASAHFYGGMVHDAPRPEDIVTDESDACPAAALLVCEVTGDEARARDRMGEEVDPTVPSSAVPSRTQVPHMSYSNVAEARAACAVALHLADALPTYAQADGAQAQSQSAACVGIITPYRGQVSVIQSILHDVTDRDVQRLCSRIIVSTVDSFQGQELAAIVISFVRSQSRAARGSLGFLKDARRLNVALTRARTCLALVGNMPYLAASDDDFGALYKHARTVGREVLVRGAAVTGTHVCERLSAWLRTRDSLRYPRGADSRAHESHGTAPRPHDSDAPRRHDAVQRNGSRDYDRGSAYAPAARSDSRDSRPATSAPSRSPPRSYEQMRDEQRDAISARRGEHRRRGGSSYRGRGGQSDTTGVRRDASTAYPPSVSHGMLHGGSGSGALLVAPVVVRAPPLLPAPGSAPAPHRLSSLFADTLLK